MWLMVALKCSNKHEKVTKISLAAQNLVSLLCNELFQVISMQVPTIVSKSNARKVTIECSTLKFHNS